MTPQRFHPLTCTRRPARPTTIRIAVLVALLAMPGQAMPQASAAMHARLRPLAWPGAYYVAPIGDDYANNGLTVSSPFRTIGKCASVAKAGETCLIRAGTYRETVRPAVSGSAGKPIVFAPYNNEAVTVSGADPVSGWSQHQGSIYRAAVSGSVPQVFVNGQMMIQAHWPNTVAASLLTPTLGVMDANTSSGTIVDSALPNLNWTGAQVWMAAHYAWSALTGNVDSYGSERLNVSGFNDLSAGNCQWLCPTPGSFYYVFGKLELLDAASEWYHDGSTLYLWAPSGLTPSNVEVKRRDVVFNLDDRQYITIQGLGLFAGRVTMNGGSGNNVIDGITARYVGHSSTQTTFALNPGTTGIELDGPNDVLSNSDIGWSSGDLVVLNGSNARVENNFLHDGDYIGAYYAPVHIDHSGSGHKILRNTIRRTGRDGIEVATNNKLSYRNLEIAFNDISEYGRLTLDGGAFYGFRADTPNMLIHHNFIHDAKMLTTTPPEGGWAIMFGIYFDGSTGSATLHHNVLWNIPNNAIMINGTPNPTKIYNNTIGAEVGSRGQGVPSSIACSGSKNDPNNCINDPSRLEVVNNILMRPYVGATGFTQHHNLDRATRLLRSS